MNKILTPRVIYWAFAIFAIIVIASPVRRVIYDTWTLDIYGFWTFAFKLHVWLPLLLIFPAIVCTYKESTNKYMRAYRKLWFAVADRPRILWAAGLIILISFTVMQFTYITGMWWTWFTLGLHFGGVVVVYTLARERIGNSQALIFAIGMIGFAVGIWEIFYQFSYTMIHGAGELPIRVPMLATVFMIPTLLAGVLTLYIARRYHRDQIDLNMLWLPLGACVITWIVWLANGMWVDAVLNEYGRWTHSEYADHFQMSTYRSGKVYLNLMPAAMLLRREWFMRQIKQLYVMAVWCCLSVATSSALFVEWLLAMVKREQYSPYFKTRSIFVKEE